ncbi:MAG: hypothetical protein R3Y60_04205 [bacterium]
MAKSKYIGDEFTKKANKIITLTNDEKIIEILSLMKEEFDDLEEDKSEFVNAVNVNINSSLDKLTKEIKKSNNIEVISELLRDIKIALVKRYSLVNEIA